MKTQGVQGTALPPVMSQKSKSKFFTVWITKLYISTTKDDLKPQA